MRLFVFGAVLLTLLNACSSTHDMGGVHPSLNQTSGGGSNLDWSTLESSVLDSEVRSSAPVPDGYKWYPDFYEPDSVVIEEMFLTSENGNKIFADLHRPEWASQDKPCHGLVLVCGGTQKGEVWHAPWRRSGSNHWAAAGFIVMDFDVQGRGQSEGVEDYNGPIHRGDLKTIIDYIASRPDILPGGIGLVSASFGCTLASGTLAVYQDLPVRFYIDFEGSHNRYTSTQWDDPMWVEIWGGHGTSDDAFWDEREAIMFQPSIHAPYIRIQSDCDHAFDYFFVEHAIDLVNAAIDGACPYARLNHEEPNIYLNLPDAGSYGWEEIDQTDDELYLYVLEASMTQF